MSVPPQHRDDSSITERVRSLLRSHLAGRMPSLEEVAAEFTMTARTLRRRLKMDGATYTGIKTDLRRNAGIELLAKPELNLQVIAERVGLAEASAFYEAFKSWTGVTPGDYRRSLLVRAHTAESRDSAAGVG